LASTTDRHEAPVDDDDDDTGDNSNYHESNDDHRHDDYRLYTHSYHVVLKPALERTVSPVISLHLSGHWVTGSLGHPITGDWVTGS